MISMDVQVTVTPPSAGSTAWILRVEVMSAVDIAAEIFAMQLQSKQGQEDAATARFSHICTLAQLSEYPADPADATGWFYRVDAIDLVFDNAQLCTSAKELILMDISNLLTSARAAVAAGSTTYSL